MDKRNLHAILGQAINLAHSEHIAGYVLEVNLDEYIKARVPKLIALMLEIRRDVLEKAND